MSLKIRLTKYNLIMEGIMISDLLFYDGSDDIRCISLKFHSSYGKQVLIS